MFRIRTGKREPGGGLRVFKEMPELASANCPKKKVDDDEEEEDEEKKKGLEDDSVRNCCVRITGNRGRLSAE